MEHKRRHDDEPLANKGELLILGISVLVISFFAIAGLSQLMNRNAGCECDCEDHGARRELRLLNEGREEIYKGVGQWQFQKTLG